MATKECTKCGKKKPLSEFHRDARRKSGRRGSCHKCCATYTARRQKQHPEKFRKTVAQWRAANPTRAHKIQAKYLANNPDTYWRSRLKCKFNMTPADYYRMLAQQDKVCGICGKPETRKVKGTLCKLAIDHNHATGEVRGLLCSRCNLGLGVFNDSQQLLKAAHIWLERSA